MLLQRQWAGSPPALRVQRWYCAYSHLAVGTLPSDVGSLSSVHLQPVKSCLFAAQWFHNSGSCWEESRTLASKVHLRSLSYPGLFPHTTRSTRIKLQRNNVFFFFLLCPFCSSAAGYLWPGACIITCGTPGARWWGNMTNSTKTSPPLSLKGLPRNLLSLEDIG